MWVDYNVTSHKNEQFHKNYYFCMILLIYGFASKNMHTQAVSCQSVTTTQHSLQLIQLQDYVFHDTACFLIREVDDTKQFSNCIKKN